MDAKLAMGNIKEYILTSLISYLSKENLFDKS